MLRNRVSLVKSVIAAAMVTIFASPAMVVGELENPSIVDEMLKIEAALERYKETFGEYPPDMTRDNELLDHVKLRWPQYEVANARDLRNAIAAAYFEAGYTNVSFGAHDRVSGVCTSALALWLGGIPDKDGKLAGFSADPEAPFGRDHITKQVNRGLLWTPDNLRLGERDKKVFIDLQVGKNVIFYKYLRNSASTVPYLVVTHEEKTVPVAYFRAQKGDPSMAYHKQSGSEDHPSGSSFNNHGEESLRTLNFCVAYARKGTHILDPGLEWFEPDRYQLILPGKDGQFGSSIPAIAQRKFRVVGPNPVGISEEDHDNLTNFSRYEELKTLLP